MNQMNQSPLKEKFSEDQGVLYKGDLYYGHTLHNVNYDCSKLDMKLTILGIPPSRQSKLSEEYSIMIMLFSVGGWI